MEQIDYTEPGSHLVLCTGLAACVNAVLLRMMPSVQQIPVPFESD